MAGASLPPHLDPRSDGGGEQGTRHASGGRRALRALLGALSTVVLLVSVGGWATYTYANGNINRIRLDLGDNRPDEKRGVTNYLVVGTDSRAGSDGEFGNVPGQRSDTTILVHLAEDGTTTMVSFPRDTYVTVPEYTDSAGKSHPAHKDKFNSAISDGGPSLLVNMVESLTGMRVDHYVSMDLEGFKAITNAIGGVDVCVLPSSFRDHFKDDTGRARVSTNTKDPMSGWNGGPGTVHVNGDQGLAFVRQRHGLPNGDIDRIKRQQQFIGAVFHKATTGDVLTNPVKLQGLLSTATSALTLDDKTSINDLRDLATQMRGVAAGSIHMETLPTHAPTEAEGGIGNSGNIMLHGVATSVQIYNPVDLARLVTPLGGHVDGVEDTASPTTEPAPGPVTVPPSQVTVVVYNGSHRSGLAAQVTKDLTEMGFRVSGTLTAEPLTYTASRVLYGAGKEDAARTVQAAVPGSILRADQTITGVHLILGSEFTKVVTPALTGAGGTSGTAASGAAPAPTTAPPAVPTTPSCTY
ncbi:LCP family protein [Pseudofrankia sp. BMG5.36]|uniref:LCP family protein n=1 Tax=Pseudofrankia sp. BMG5.36 TaxID=1834512 RepID=UPI0008D99C30|nr:LCP family protein [Pseudofrankia sp. BMG5.36]OHV74814.1 transcriptional regulator [Pseudofrankia sp. BMG5.36]